MFPDWVAAAFSLAPPCFWTVTFNVSPGCRFCSIWKLMVLLCAMPLSSETEILLRAMVPCAGGCGVVVVSCGIETLACAVLPAPSMAVILYSAPAVPMKV